MCDRRAFTLVEVLVALVVLTVGLLALLSAAAWATRMIGAGHRLAEATAVAGRHLAVWQRAPCAVSDGGKVVTHSVSFDIGGRARTTLTAVRPC